MPKPVHIVCSESGAEDRLTGLVSLFNLIETIQVQQIPEEDLKGPILINAVSIRITATWMRLPGEEGQEFEFSVMIYLPQDDQEYQIAKGELVLEKPFHRISSRIVGTLPFKSSGIMRVESRLRRVGADAWVTQECPVIIDVKQPVPSDDSASANTSSKS